MKRGLRSAIDEKCKDCIFDELAKGNWRQQVTLCSVYSCPLWSVRPVSSAAIPESVLSYYEVKPGDPCLRGRSLTEGMGIGKNGDPHAQSAQKAPQSSPEAILEPDFGAVS